jgi:hypothetical protein
MNFLLEDKTDETLYVPDEYVCKDFALDVHNNAERAGIRAGFVIVTAEHVRHAMNVFRTTDGCRVLIDCVGSLAPKTGWSYDKIVGASLGGNYSGKFLFEEGDWITAYKWGTIQDLCVYW